MATYLIRASYTAEGVKGLLREGALKRRRAAEQAMENVGGTVREFYYALGDDDAILICDAPDNIAAAALSLAVNASGAVTTRTTVLMTAEEMQAACDRNADYRPPGG